MSRKAQFTVANARTSGAALGFSMTWNQLFKKVEEGSSAANHNSTTKAAAKNQPGVVFKCFKYEEIGHKAERCKKPMLSKGKALLDEEFEDQEME